MSQQGQIFSRSRKSLQDSIEIKIYVVIYYVFQTSGQYFLGRGLGS